MRRTRRLSGFYIQPPIIGWDYVAQVNSTGRSLMSINVTGGGSQIPPIVGETVYVGTSARSFDVGITRVRSYSQGVLGVAENEIEWNTNLWVWCPRTFAPMAKLQRVSGSGDRPQVWMDYDISPVPLPPKVNAQGPLVVQPNEENTYSVAAYPMERNATVTGGPSVALFPDGTATANGWSVNISFPTPGYKIAVISATDSNGQTGRRVLPIMCGLAPTSSVIVESISWQMNGGVRVDVKMPITALRPLQPAIFRYGTKFLTLWQIEPEQEITPDATMVNVQFLSALAMTGELLSHSMLFEDKSRDSWYSLPGLNAVRAIHTMLEFHSTTNLVTNIEYSSNRMTLPIHSQQFHQQSLLSQIVELAKNCLSAFYEEMDGTIRVVEEPMLLADRSRVPVYSVNPISSIRESANKPIGQLQAGGFAYQTPFISRWPGTTPEIWAQTKEEKGYVVSSQSDLNQVAGLLASYDQTNDVSFTVASDIDELPPFSSLWTDVRVGKVEPLRAQVRMSDGVDPVVEVTAKKETTPLIGETIQIPTEPEPTPVEFPSPPPIQPPPSAVTGYAFIRCEHHIVRTPQIYSQYPHWEVIAYASNYPHPTDPNHVPRFVDFRYIEAPGGPVIIAAVSSGYIIRCNNPTGDNPTWETIASPNLFAPVGNYNYAFYSLMTMVQDYRHIGIVANVSVGGGDVQSRYYYSADYGGSWNYGVIRTTFYWYPDWTVDGTAGTNQITALGFWSGGSVGKTYQSNDRGATWSIASNWSSGFREGIGRIRKPWQYGVSGQIIYICGFRSTGSIPAFICGKSTDNLGSITEMFTIPGHTSTIAGMEVWTFNEKEIHVITHTDATQSWNHSVTFDGGATWNVTYTKYEPTKPSFFSLRGNPANNKEWTVVLQYNINPGQNPPRRSLIYQTLDGGLTFDDLTGDWWDSGLGNTIGGKPRDFLILPPFIRKIRREP